jgi:MEMO1 family protein
MSVRRPAVAGGFYPAGRAELERALHDSYMHPLGPQRLPPLEGEAHGVVACVCPHAGYVYSGPVAAHSYLQTSAMRKPDLVVVVGPNHYGVGSGVSTYEGGEWETPLGRVRVDRRAAKEIVELAGIVDYDPEAHRMEHSIEVQLPFLQQLYGEFGFLPICLAMQDEATARDLGKGLARLLEGREAVLVASSDLTHYEPASQAREKDMAALEKVERMDVRGFYETLERRRVTACGYGAIATVMEACGHLGFKRGTLLSYATSGDVTGDDSAVVGYPSLRFSE